MGKCEQGISGKGNNGAKKEPGILEIIKQWRTSCFYSKPNYNVTFSAKCSLTTPNPFYSIIFTICAPIEQLSLSIQHLLSSK